MPGAIFGFPTRPTTGQGMVWNEGLGGAMAPGSFTITGATLTGFGDNRLAFGSATGGLEDSSNLTFDGSTLTVTGAVTISGTVTLSALTATRLVYATTGGALTTTATITTNGTRLDVGDGLTANANIIHNGVAANGSGFFLRVAGANRWGFLKNGTAESGSDSGSDFAYNAYDDSGNLIDAPITITRAAGGTMTLVRPVALSTASSGLTISKTTGTTLTVSSTDNAAITCSGGFSMGRNSTITRDFNGAVSLTVTNSNTSTSADARNVLANDGGLQTLFILGGSGNTGTYFTGRSRANTMFVGSGSALNALCIGFIGQDKPIVFGSNSTEVGGWTSGTIASGSFQVLYSGQSALAVTGGATFGAATTSRSSIRLPHGTAPSAPVDGDMWTTTAGLYVRINGVTVGPLS